MAAVRTGWWLRAVGAVIRRPSLWATAVATAFRLARPGWWRRPPFVPVPDPAYLHFRLETMYGSTLERADPADLVAFLRWCREFPD
jgi:hypothetical protein